MPEKENPFSDQTQRYQARTKKKEVRRGIPLTREDRALHPLEPFENW